MTIDRNFKKFLKDVVKTQAKQKLSKKQKEHLEENANLTTLVAASTLCCKAISLVLSLLKCYDKIDFNAGIFVERDFNKSWHLYFLAPPFVNRDGFNPSFLDIVVSPDKKQDEEHWIVSTGNEPDESMRKPESMDSSSFHVNTMMISNVEALLKYWKTNTKPTIIPPVAADEEDHEKVNRLHRTSTSFETCLLCSMYGCISLAPALVEEVPAKSYFAGRVLNNLVKLCNDDSQLLKEKSVKDLIDMVGRCVYVYRALAAKYGFKDLDVRGMTNRKIGSRMIRAAIQLDPVNSLVNSYCEHLLQAVDFIMEMNLRMPDIIADHLSKGVVIFTDQPDEPN